MSEPTPTASVTLKPEARVSTNMQTLVAIMSATAILAGGIVSVKADVNAAAKDAAEAKQTTKEIREDLYRLRLQLGAPDVSIGPTQPRKATP